MNVRSFLALIAVLSCAPGALAQDVVWDGGAGTVFWHDAENWTNDTLPGPDDDVLIKQTIITVCHEKGDTVVGSLRVEDATKLKLSGGSIETKGDFEVFLAELIYDGGTIHSTVTFNNSAVRYGNGELSPAEYILIGLNFLKSDIPNGQKIRLRGAPGYGGSRLSGIGFFENHGTITMESIGGAWDATLVNGVTFTNGPSGVIHVLAGDGGDRTIVGNSGHSFRNQGSIIVDEGTSLTAQSSTFYHESGTISADGRFEVDAGVLNYSGGTIDGTVSVRSGSVRVLNSAQGTGNIQTRGSCRLLVLDHPGTTVSVAGSTEYGNGILETAGIELHGAIELTSTGSATDSALVIDSGATLTVAPTGSVAALAGAGGDRRIDGDLVNGGTLVPGFPDHLTIDGQFTQTETGLISLAFAGDAPAQHTMLHVTGDATLSGAVDIEIVDGHQPVYDTPLVVLSSDGQLSGSLDNADVCDTSTVHFDLKASTVSIAFEDPEASLGDANGDGIVDIDDLLEVLAAWGPCPDDDSECCDADFDASGSVDVDDLLSVLAHWS